MAIELLKTAATVLLRVEMILMLVRAIMSWFSGGGRAYELVVMMTEPIIYPIRLICDKLIPETSLPIDIPFIVTYLLLYLIEVVLGVL